MKKLFLSLSLLVLVIGGCSALIVVVEKVVFHQLYIETPSHPLVDAARKQIGVVRHYDSAYYANAEPPADSGACSDVIWRALRDVGYDLKSKLDRDMKAHPERYNQKPDQNVNVRRVVNIKTYFDSYAESLPMCTEEACMKDNTWKAGDIVTFDQIPGGLWHIAIISNKRLSNGVPLLIHNHGWGTQEDTMFLRWPSPMSGHYRLTGI